MKGARSRETKKLGNEVAGTPVNLNSRQTMTTLGAGCHFRAGEWTGICAEALAVVDFKVKHLVPVVVPSEFGQPSVSTVNSTIEGNGFGAALGVRHWISESVELEARLSQVRTRGDVLRTGEEISDAETSLGAGGYVHDGEGNSVGTPFSRTGGIPAKISTTSESSASRSAINSDPCARCGVDGAHGLGVLMLLFGPAPFRAVPAQVSRNAAPRRS